MKVVNLKEISIKSLLATLSFNQHTIQLLSYLRDTENFYYEQIHFTYVVKCVLELY